MFEFLKKMFRKKKVEEVKKVVPKVSEFGLRSPVSKPAPKVTPSYYGHHHSPREAYLPSTPAYQPHPNPVAYDSHDSAQGSTESFLMGMVTGALADEVVHAVSKAVETPVHTPAPEPVHVTPSNSSSDYSSSSSSSDSSWFSSNPIYSSNSSSDSYSSSSSSDYSSSSSSDYSSSSSSGGDW